MDKSLFICDLPAQEETEKQSFEAGGLRGNVVPRSRYLVAYAVKAEYRDAWFNPQVEKWVEGVMDIEKVAKRHPQTSYVDLGMLLNLKLQ